MSWRFITNANYFLILTLLVSVLFSCNKVESFKLKTISHENGLTLSIPEKLLYKKIDSGFIIFPKDGLDKRSPIQVLVNYYITPLNSSLKQKSKTVSGKTIYYRKLDVSGGSGGAEYALDTYSIMTHGYVHTEEVIQSEMDSNPDFALSWQIVEGISIDN